MPHIATQGKKAVDALAGQSAKLLNGIPVDDDDFFGRQLAFNLMPMLADREGSVREERRIVDETRKIMQDDGLIISATCVRAPVFYSAPSWPPVDGLSEKSLPENFRFKMELPLA